MQSKISQVSQDLREMKKENFKIDFNEMNQNQKNKYIRDKMRISPSIMLKQKEVLKMLDKTKENAFSKQTFSRQKNSVFLSGSTVDQGQKIQSFDQLMRNNPSMSSNVNLRS